jgi:L-fuculose-phosphate aldolase
MLETICETLVDAYKRNWITSRDGNVSIRHHDRDHFYITPSGVRKQTLQPDQFKKIKLLESSWEELEYTDISRSLKPSGEIPLHYGLQKKMGQHSNEVRVVVHLHPTYCIAAIWQVQNSMNHSGNCQYMPPITEQAMVPFPLPRAKAHQT